MENENISNPTENTDRPNQPNDCQSLLEKFLGGGLSLGAGLQYYKRSDHKHNSNCEDEEDDCSHCHHHCRHHNSNGNGSSNGIVACGHNELCSKGSSSNFFSSGSGSGLFSNGPSTVLEPHATNLPQMEPLTSVWNEDTHLHVFHIAFKYLNAYKLYVWPHCVVNPAGLLQSNLKYILCTPEGNAERSPLSLTMEVAICLGAFVEKNFETSLQYWMKARDTVSHLSTKVDYSLAMAVTAMAYHAELWEDNYERSKSYYELALSICQKLGAYNSDAYIHSLYGLAGITNTKECVVKTLDELKRVKQCPYFSISNECGSLAKLLPFNPKELRKINLMFNIIANISMGITILKQRAKEGGNGMVEYVVKFIKKLQTLEEELYYHPYSLWLTMGLKMMLYNIEADYLWGLNIKDVALKRAIKYLEESQKPEFTYLVGYPAVKCEKILEIFFEMNEFDLLELQITCLKVDEDRYPGLKILLLKYKGLLYQRKIERLEEQMKQLSSQAQLAQQVLTQHGIQPSPFVPGQPLVITPLPPQPLSPLLQRPTTQQSPVETPRSPHPTAPIPIPAQNGSAPYSDGSIYMALSQQQQQQQHQKQMEEQRQLYLKQMQMQQQLEEAHNLQRLHKLQHRRQEQMQENGSISLGMHGLTNAESSTAAALNFSNGGQSGNGFLAEEFAQAMAVCNGLVASASSEFGSMLTEFPPRFSPTEEFLRYGKKKRRTEIDEDDQMIEDHLNYDQECTLQQQEQQQGDDTVRAVGDGLSNGALSLEVVHPSMEYQRRSYPLLGNHALARITGVERSDGGVAEAIDPSPIVDSIDDANSGDVPGETAVTALPSSEGNTFVDMLLNPSPLGEGESRSLPDTESYFDVVGGNDPGECCGIEKDLFDSQSFIDPCVGTALSTDMTDLGDVATIEAEIETMWAMDDAGTGSTSAQPSGNEGNTDPIF